MQNNNIAKIPSLKLFPKLYKLCPILPSSYLRYLRYLDRNCIQVVEGLEGVPLEELHISHQQLPPDVQLTFEQKSLATLAVPSNCYA